MEITFVQDVSESDFRFKVFPLQQQLRVGDLAHAQTLLRVGYAIRRTIVKNKFTRLELSVSDSKD
jgi:FAD synthase